MVDCSKCLHDEVCDKSSLSLWNAIYHRDCCPDFLQRLNPPWIPVTERLPEEDVSVLLLCKNYAMFVGFFRHSRDGGRWHTRTVLNSSKLLNRGRVTHWMPLPEPPKEEDNG